MKYVNTVSGVCKNFVRNELEYCRMLLSVIVYVYLAFRWLRVRFLAHKPVVLTAIYFLSVCWHVSGWYL